MSNISGIDLSHHNGDIDFEKASSSGVNFAILRTGFGKKHPNQYDKRFEEYYNSCKIHRIPVGAYHYSYALTSEAAEAEADFMLEILKGKSFEYPIFIDIEEKTQATLSKDVCSEIVTAFCSKLESAGYFAGIYSYDSFFSANLPVEIQNRFASWTARVENIKPTYCSNYGMWQNSWKGTVNGISGDVDMNICYKDYPSIIKAKGLNGFSINSVKYNVTASSSLLTLQEVGKVASICKNLGMIVKIEKN